MRRSKLETEMTAFAVKTALGPTRKPELIRRLTPKG